MILVINSGSSSIKFSIYTPIKTLLYRGEIESIYKSPKLTISNNNHQHVFNQTIQDSGIKAGLQAIFAWFESLPDAIKLTAVGHRIVHGGKYFLKPTLVTDDVMEKISSLIPLAPYHQAENILAIKIIKNLYPEIPQVACFDTSFHQTQEKLATLFAIPRNLTDEGIIRYGFHGLSYEYIASVINQHIGDIGKQRVIVAHLGSGASMCAISQHKSIATSMGFTALDGLMMGTRCGSIDPGLILYLLKEKKWSIEQVSTMLYKKSGLLGVSSYSSDMQELQSSTEQNAIEAVNLFCFLAAKEIAALCGVLQGCDAIIFTAGIGERSALVRKKICDRLKWLGVVLNDEKNNSNSSVISQDSSQICVGVIKTNEEYMIYQHTVNLLDMKQQHLVV